MALLRPRRAEERSSHAAVLSEVEGHLVRHFAKCGQRMRVELFGSVANGLSVRSSNDLDVCLHIEDTGTGDATVRPAREPPPLRRAVPVGATLPCPALPSSSAAGSAPASRCPGRSSNLLALPAGAASPLQKFKASVIEDVGELFEEHLQWPKVLVLSHARVPVLKLVHPDVGTRVDITVNNTLACINTKLLADYSAVDPRLAQLVREW